MPRTKISFHLELLVEEAPADTLAAALQAVTAEIAKSSATLQARGETIGDDGSVRWQVRAWSESELARCVGCGREVVRADCDVTAEGERCRSCALSGAVATHFEAAVVAANERGYTEGLIGIPRRGSLIKLLLLR